MVKGIKKREWPFLLVAILAFFIVIGKYFPMESVVKFISRKYLVLSYQNKLGKNFRVSGKGQASSIPILTYHSIVNYPDGVNVTVSVFEDQMLALKRNGWQTVSQAEFLRFINDEALLPDKSFLLTFDDGRKQSYYPVDPLMEALGFQAVNFVITQHFVGSSGSSYLSLSEMREMLENGRWEIQLHANNSHDLVDIDQLGNKGHFLSNKVWLATEARLETDAEYRARLVDEYKSSKHEFESALGFTPTGYAYPFGDFGQRTQNFASARKFIKEAIREIEPIYQFYQIWDEGGYSQNYPHITSDNYMVKRIGVDPSWNGDELLNKLENGREKSLPYTDRFSTNFGWNGISADIRVGNGHLEMTPDGKSGSSMAFLDGSSLWSNYTYEVTVESFTGETLSLVAGYKDNDNYLQCDFKRNLVRLTLETGGRTVTLKSVRIPRFELQGRMYGAGLGDGTASCIRSGETVLSSTIDPVLLSGGVGLKVWGSTGASVTLWGVEVK